MYEPNGSNDSEDTCDISLHHGYNVGKRSEEEAKQTSKEVGNIRKDHLRRTVDSEEDDLNGLANEQVQRANGITKDRLNIHKDRSDGINCRVTRNNEL